jgi:hypothetical protein
MGTDLKNWTLSKLRIEYETLTNEIEGCARPALITVRVQRAIGYEILRRATMVQRRQMKLRMMPLIDLGGNRG